MATPLFSQRLHSVITGRNNLTKVWDLPALPFTELFGVYDEEYPKLDQELYLCPESGIFQLKNVVDSTFLYDLKNYTFRTSLSPKINRELDFLISSSSLLEVTKPNSRILEIGGNGSVMAQKLANRFEKYVVCDPIITDFVSGSLEFWNGVIEDRIDHIAELQPNIVIGRHVLEHLNAPLTVLKDILKVLRYPTLFVFEFPNFRLMQRRHRLDAVFHQHLNYFDEYSVVRFINALECKVISLQNNYEGSNGGSLIVTFTNESKFLPQNPSYEETMRLANLAGPAMENFDTSLNLFKMETSLLKEKLRSWSGKTYGFGAGLMLATLDYHLDGQIQDFDHVYDDDETKIGLTWRNLDLSVLHSSAILDDEQNLIFVTSMENQRSIRNRLSAFPKSTIIGFSVS